MKFMKLLGLVLLVTLLAVTVVSAQEDDTSGITLPILLDGDTFEGVFAETVTGQLLAFNGSEGDVVTIAMTQSDENSTLDPYLVLVGQEGQVLASDDDSGEASLSSLIEDLELPYDGSYYIVATTFSNLNREEELADPLAYTVTVSGNTQPTALEGFDENIVQYLRGVIEIGNSADSELTATEPVFFVTFEGEAGQVLNFTLASEDFDPLLYVFGPDGARIGVNDDADGLNSGLTELELSETGTYMMFITSYGYSNAAEEEFDVSGMFTLTVEESS